MVEVDRRPGTGARMRARAHLVTELRSAADGSVRTCASRLYSEAPLLLRMARAKTSEPWAAGVTDVLRVALTAGAAGRVGGDELDLTVEVGAGTSLVLAEISPTLLLPGPHGRQSRTRVRVHVAAGGTLIWLPEPMIAARGCDHLNEVVVRLEDGARFLMREEILMGRHGERGGQVRQRVSVRLAGRPLYRQDLEVGTVESASPPVLGEHRAVGSTLVVDPGWTTRPPAARVLDAGAAVLPLEGPAVLLTALADDNLALRRHLAAGLAALGEPWAPRPATDTTTRDGHASRDHEGAPS
ncbi:urease accessory protein UreD [Nocardioides marmoribigeumensis]